MSKIDWEKNNLTKIFKWKLPNDITILDVACGLSLRSKYIPASLRVGVDIYPKYFKHIKSDVPYAVLKYDVRKLDEIFAPNSFDLVIALDIVEHLEKDEAFQLIKQCEKIARKAVIIETPEGYVPQNIDILGHGGHEWQTHRSGWSVHDFERRGYETKLRKYRMTDKKRHTEIKINPEINLIDAIKYV